MKTRRRQELKTNTLSVYLQDIAEYFQRNANKVILMGLLVVALVAAWLFRGRTLLESERQSWQAYYDVPRFNADRANVDWFEERAEHWQDVIATATDSDSSWRARWMLADMYVQQAAEVDSEDRQKAYLAKAQEQLNNLRLEQKDNVILQGAVLQLLSSIEVNLFMFSGEDGHRNQARRYLETIRDAREFRGRPQQTVALYRLNELERMKEPIRFAQQSETTQAEVSDGASAEIRTPDATDTMPSTPEAGDSDDPLTQD